MWRRARPTRTATVEFRVDAQKHRRNEAKVRREPSISPSRDVRFYGFFRDWSSIEKSRKSAQRKTSAAPTSNRATWLFPEAQPTVRSCFWALAFHNPVNTLARKK